ncbi:leucine-rich repeat and calponin homology domain-containing protein-like isoform X2 [Symsagittifera roscoffensis]|uniref:leucine-rich repeat and calponin homology domain-containing protein-like isoform X2 n=1 Tax=Symsagittifera roscoffensis TaxID=84072 RepID=UPI00307B3E77
MALLEDGPRLPSLGAVRPTNLSNPGTSLLSPPLTSSASNVPHSTSTIQGYGMRLGHGQQGTLSSSAPLVMIPINKKISEAEDSSVLALANRSLSAVPNEVYFAAGDKLSDTRFVDISKNCLSELGDGLCKLMSLNGLNCEKNSIRSISPFVSNLVHLQFLNLSCNLLTELPEALSRISRLKILILCSNNIASVTPHIARLTHLEKLDVSHNEITTLPDEICRLSALRCLNLRQNALRTLPEELGKLELHTLDISVNRLRHLPLSLTRMRVCLKELSVHDNPLDSPPLHIARRGRTHVLNYLSKQEVTERVKLGLLMHPNTTNSSANPNNTQPSFNFGASHGGFSANGAKNSSRDSGYQTSESEGSLVRNAWASRSFPSQGHVTKTTRSNSLSNGPPSSNQLTAAVVHANNAASNLKTEVPRKYSAVDCQVLQHSQATRIKSTERSNSFESAQIHSKHKVDHSTTQNTQHPIISKDNVSRRVSMPSPASNHKAINRSSHDSVDSTSSTLTDASNENSPVRQNPLHKNLVTVNGHGDVRSRNARDEINLADFENFDDDDDQDEGEEEAILASIRRRSNALSFSETPENGTLDARKTEQTTCEAVPYNEERKCPIVFDCDTLTLHSPPLQSDNSIANTPPTNYKRQTATSYNSPSSSKHEAYNRTPLGKQRSVPGCIQLQQQQGTYSVLQGYLATANTLKQNNSFVASYSQHISNNGGHLSPHYNNSNNSYNNYNSSSSLSRAIPPKPAPKPSQAAVANARRYQSPMRPNNIQSVAVQVLPPKFPVKTRSTSCDPKRLSSPAFMAGSNDFIQESHCVVTRIIENEKDTWTNPANRLNDQQTRLAWPTAKQTNKSDAQNGLSWQSQTSSVGVQSVKTSASTFTPQTAVICIEDTVERHESTLSPSSSDSSISISSDPSRSSYVPASAEAGKITARRQALNFKDERRALKSLKQLKCN